MNKKIAIRTAAIFGFIAVILGALGAHALEKVLTESQLASFTTGVRYQMWHALALLATVALSKESTINKWVYCLWTAGVILFSFSIYLLSTADLLSVKLRWLGPVTPLGGLLLISGWLTLIIKPLTSNKHT